MSLCRVNIGTDYVQIKIHHLKLSSFYCCERVSDIFYLLPSYLTVIYNPYYNCNQVSYISLVCSYSYNVLCELLSLVFAVFDKIFGNDQKLSQKHTKNSTTMTVVNGCHKLQIFKTFQNYSEMPCI